MTDVVVTGIGVVTPIGTGKDDFWDGLMERRSGAREISNFDASDLPVRIACEFDFDPSSHMKTRDIKRTDRFTQMALVAGALAWEDSGMTTDEISSERIGVVVGSGIGGLSSIEEEHRTLLSSGPRRVSPMLVPKMMANAASGAVAMNLGLRGPNYAPVSACATSGNAIGEAYRAIQSGAADVVLAGGSEAAITPLSVAAFSKMGALSKRNDDPQRASRPFEAGRDGFVMGEGAGILVLERRDVAEQRNAGIVATVAGYGASADAYHITQPEPEGAGAVLAMSAALRTAGAEPGDVDYVNAHGTGTQQNDRAETAAMKSLMGTEVKRIPVSSTKSQMGHLLGAAGAVEAAATILAIERGTIPATINLDEPDPECDLDYAGDGPRSHDVRLALSNSFGFGGHNVCLAFKAA